MRIPVGDASPSRLRLLAECGARYGHRYLERRPEPPSEPMLVGSAVHAGLEAAGRAALAEPRCRTLGVDPGRLASLLPDGLPPGRRRAAEEILALAAPELDLRAVRLVEHAWEIRTPDGTAVGIFDRLDELPGAARVVDYKTGCDVPSRGEAEDDPQVLLYALAARALYPAAAVSVELHFVALGTVVAVPADDALLARAGSFLRDGLRRIRAPDLRPIVGRHCAACHYRAGCGAYLAALRSPATPALAAAGAPLVELLRERHRLAVLAKLAEEARRDLDGEVRARLNAAAEAEGARALEAGGLRARILTRTRRDPPPLAEVVRIVAAASGRPPDEVLALVGRADLPEARRLLRDVPAEVRDATLRELEERRLGFDASSYVDVREAGAAW